MATTDIMGQHSLDTDTMVVLVTTATLLITASMVRIMAVLGITCRRGAGITKAIVFPVSSVARVTSITGVRLARRVTRVAVVRSGKSAPK